MTSTAMEGTNIHAEPVFGAKGVNTEGELAVSNTRKRIVDATRRCVRRSGSTKWHLITEDVMSWRTDGRYLLGEITESRLKEL